MVDISPVKDEASYEAALKRVEALMDAEEGTKELDELSILVTLIEAYENEHYPIEAPDPVEAIKLHMELTGLERADLAQVIGQTRASELLHRRRKLNLTNIRKINEAWKVPVSALIADYELANTA